jgi:menaquinol-cytochrome c reductase iron-sulfur subunit
MQTEPAPGDDRRDFLKKSCAVCVGGAVGVVPTLAGIAVYLDPLRRKADTGLLARVTSLESLPADGTPVMFPIIAIRTDAWNKSIAPVGAVYVRKVNGDQVQAFNVTCPHAGCAVEFQPEKKGYFCPCHNSLFTPEGKRTDGSPSARDLDSLKSEVRANGEVWVQFQNFETGKAHKVAVS